MEAEEKHSAAAKRNISSNCTDKAFCGEAGVPPLTEVYLTCSQMQINICCGPGQPRK